MSVAPTVSNLIAKTAEMLADYEQWWNGQIGIQGGSITDPNSFDENGLKVGPLGYYPVTGPDGTTRYLPSYDRLRRLPATNGAEAAPAIGFADATGFYRAGNYVGLSINGVPAIKFGKNGGISIGSAGGNLVEDAVDLYFSAHGLPFRAHFQGQGDHFWGYTTYQAGTTLTFHRGNGNRTTDAPVAAGDTIAGLNFKVSIDAAGTQYNAAAYRVILTQVGGASTAGALTDHVFLANAGAGNVMIEALRFGSLGIGTASNRFWEPVTSTLLHRAVSLTGYTATAALNPASLLNRTLRITAVEGGALLTSDGTELLMDGFMAEVRIEVAGAVGALLRDNLIPRKSRLNRMAVASNPTINAAYCRVAAPVLRAFSIRKIVGGVATTIGTLTFQANAKAGVFAINSTHTFEAGDELRVQATTGSADTVMSGLVVSIFFNIFVAI